MVIFLIIGTNCSVKTPVFKETESILKNTRANYLPKKKCRTKNIHKKSLCTQGVFFYS